MDHRNELRTDFMAWSGGCKPDSEEQIDSYLLAALPGPFDREWALGELELWMREDSTISDEIGLVIKLLTDLQIAMDCDNKSVGWEIWQKARERFNNLTQPIFDRTTQL